MTDTTTTPRGRPDAAGDEEAPAFWEPWQPRVGQRVRCLPSPECKTPGHPDSVTRQLGQIGHDSIETGLLATVIKDGEHRAPFGHRFIVEYDVPHWMGRHLIGFGCYAALELEPLPAEEAAP